MIDKMRPIRGHFKVDKIVDGEVVDTYEDKNTVMARIPELYAGMVSGNYTQDLDLYSIGAIAIGTGGTRIDELGNEVPKIVRDTRSMLFSEHDFWNTPTQIAQDQPAVLDKNKLVYQTTFGVVPRGDTGQNTAFATPIEIKNEGTTYPHGPCVEKPTNPEWTPCDYRGPARAAASGEAADGVTGEISLQANVIYYSVTIGQFTANNDDDSAIGYSEAGLYLKLGRDTEAEGNPLGTLFSMKTFPQQWKNSTCSLKIEWRLYF